MIVLGWNGTLFHWGLLSVSSPPASPAQEQWRAGGGQTGGIERREIFKDDQDRKSSLDLSRR